MTVAYNSFVHTSSFGGFLKLLMRWKGSIYKLVWKDLLIYAVIYSLIACIYHFALNDYQKIIFETLFDYFQRFQQNIPVSFILGFYVSTVVSRWWDQYVAIPYLTKLAILLNCNLIGSDDKAKLMRRTVVRYCCLGTVLTFTTICTQVKLRFPTLEHITAAGFFLPNEQRKLDLTKTSFNKYFIPFMWSSSILIKARKENYINNDYALLSILDEVNNLRGKCHGLLNYDWVGIPLAYTQVTTLAVHMYFFACLFSRQYIPIYTETGLPTNQGEIIVPLFTFLQYIFFMGWLKVAELLINPFGDDDDDFEINPIIDRNLKNSYKIVDTLHGEFPELVKDDFWDLDEIILPYTEASLKNYKEKFAGTATNISISEKDQQIVQLIPVPVDNTDSARITMTKRRISVNPAK